MHWEEFFRSDGQQNCFEIIKVLSSFALVGPLWKPVLCDRYHRVFNQPSICYFDYIHVLKYSVVPFAFIIINAMTMQTEDFRPKGYALDNIQILYQWNDMK